MDPGLRQQVESYGPVAYLVTVGEGGRPHAVSVLVAWDGDTLTAGAGSRTTANIGDGAEVTLLWAPPPGDPYSLIVDGEAVIIDGEAPIVDGEAPIVDGEAPIVDGEAGVDPGATGPRVVVRPRSAVRHRLAAAAAPADDAPGCIAVPVPDA